MRIAGRSATFAHVLTAVFVPVLMSVLALGGRAPAQVTQRVSIGSSGAQGLAYSVSPSVSADGRIVVFTSLSAFDPTDTNQRVDVYVRDRDLHQTQRVSVANSGGQGDDASTSASISADGRSVAFASFASNLVPGDSNGTEDVFVRDLQTGLTTRVSVSSSGIEGNDVSGYPSISADGRYVVFWSYATNLVAGDTNGCADVFVHDRIARTTTRVSVDDSGVQGDQDSLSCSISADGSLVAFESFATNLVPLDTNAVEDVFVRDRNAGTTRRVSVGPGGAQSNGESQAPAISADGRFVAFLSWSPALVPGDANGKPDIFLRDLARARTTLVTVSTGGAQANEISFRPTLSADGRYVAFVSYASNLVSGDTNGSLQADAFLRDTSSRTTTRVNLGPGGAQDDGSVGSIQISGDGTVLAFDSDGANLVHGDTNGAVDVFVRDLAGTSFESLCDPGAAGVIACPCGNAPSGPRRGCDNSAATGGAALTASGGAFLSEDTLVFAASAERASSTSILLQGSVASAAGAVYGQGVRCVSGGFRRLFSGTASAGSLALPDLAGGAPTVSSRSAALGVPITAGQSRWYLVAYRDPIVLGGCPSTSTFNATQTGRVGWSP